MKPPEKLRTRIAPDDSIDFISSAHRAWRRDMTRALGAVETQHAAVERMEAVRVVNALLNGDKPSK